MGVVERAWPEVYSFGDVKDRGAFDSLVALLYENRNLKYGLVVVLSVIKCAAGASEPSDRPPRKLKRFLEICGARCVLSLPISPAKAPQLDPVCTRIRITSIQSLSGPCDIV